MSGTYEKATAEGVLRWRWDFARRVMRLETLNANLYTIHAGELDTLRDWGGKMRYNVEILSVGKTVEGGEYEGGGDIFAGVQQGIAKSAQESRPILCTPFIPPRSRLALLPVHPTHPLRAPASPLSRPSCGVR